MPVNEDDFYCIERSCPDSGKLLTLPWRDCGNRECCTCKTGGSHYPECPTCGKVMRHNVSAPNVIWTGTISQRYRDRNAENYHGDGTSADGYWAWSRNTPDGKPKAERITTWQEARSFAKRNGMADPRELPKNLEPAENGKDLLNTRGLPGTEI